jgi:hypothetical protein
MGGWVDVFKTIQRQRDFNTAVQTCDNETVARHVRAWVDGLAAGVNSSRSLRERVDED